MNRKKRPGFNKNRICIETYHYLSLISSLFLFNNLYKILLFSHPLKFLNYRFYSEPICHQNV